MQKKIIWEGIEYHSLESCLLNITDTGSKASGCITGEYQQINYQIDYRITLNQRWETIFFEITSRLNNSANVISFTSDGKGNWYSHGKLVAAFNGCIDIDISLTPFTNTLPINRLKFSATQEIQVKVLYIDILKHEVLPLYQRYCRLSPNEYRYQNIPNDFESVLVVDDLGLVVKYPALFNRIAIT